MTRRRARSMAPDGAWSPSRGFTLLELIATLAVTAILLSIGVPGFLDIVRNNRATANANELVTALAIARSEAVRRGARVGLCRSDDGATCGGTWAQGWIVFADGAATDDATPVVSQVLRVWPAPGGTAAVATRRTDGTAVALAWIRFLPRGDVRTNVGAPVVLHMAIEGCSDTQGREVEINAVGRTTARRAACA